MMIKVRRLIKTATRRPVAMLAGHRAVVDEVSTSEADLDWPLNLCEINPSSDTVCRLQLALRYAGHNPGVIDGVVGEKTMIALTAYQKAHGLTPGQLTIDSLRSLEVF